MTAARALELHITRQLMNQRQSAPATSAARSPLARRLIGVLATTAGLFLLGSYLQELLFALLAGATIIALGYSKK
ncbi:MAG: hypothetical protein AAGA91_08330 [Pseudomonadota bacterium]